MNSMLSLLTRGNSVPMALFIFFYCWSFLYKAYGHPLVTCCGTHVFNCSVASAHSLAAADSFGVYPYSRRTLLVNQIQHWWNLILSTILNP